MSSDVGTANLSPMDIARREGVPLPTVYKWNSEGTGPPFMKIGRHVRYRLADVEAWEAERIVTRAERIVTRRSGNAA